MAVINPLSWSRLQYADKASWIDFAGSHALFHASLDATVLRLFPATPYGALPIGDGAGPNTRPDWLWGPQAEPRGPDGNVDARALAQAIYPGDAWLQAVQASHVGPARVLGVAAPPDLTSYDLTDPDQFATWVYLVGQDDARLRVAAGI